MRVRREEEHRNISRLINITCDDTDDFPCLSPIPPYYSHSAAFFDFSRVLSQSCGSSFLCENNIADFL